MSADELSPLDLHLSALAEHVAVVVAYPGAAPSLVLLLGMYLAGALRSSRRGLVAGGAMTAIYGLLYMLVLSEDYSLLLGAIILFAALAAFGVPERALPVFPYTPVDPLIVITDPTVAYPRTTML